MSTTQAAQVPHPITAGPEMAALHRFFRDCTWKGNIVEGGMGPGTPEMAAEGRGTHTTIQDGLWIVGDYEQDQLLPDGTFVLKWQLHWVVGWDPDAGGTAARTSTTTGTPASCAAASTATSSPSRLWATAPFVSG